MLNLPALEPRIDVAVFGGSGFYDFVDDLAPVEISTPYGAPSEPPMVGTMGTRTVGFIPRHGHDHRIPAHQVNFRANVWAMAALGARALIAPFACGSLRATIAPGDFVMVDQLVDRTHSRVGTFFDGPHTHHASFADPYDESLRRQLLDHGRAQGLTMHDGGTVVVIPGPRFSSRAESRWHAQMGWDLVNMTQAPEAALAAEAGVPYVGVGLVTDYDAGLDEDPSIVPVTEAEVFAFLASNADAVRGLLAASIPLLRLDGSSA